MTQATHDLVRRFFAGLDAGQFEEGLLAEDFTGSTARSEEPSPRDKYIGGIAMLQQLFGGGLRYSIESITAEDDRAAVEARSQGTFTDGEPFANRYVFMFRVRDGQIASVYESMDTVKVNEKIIPRMMALLQPKR
jgi:uncharacterized protein